MYDYRYNVPYDNGYTIGKKDVPHAVQNRGGSYSMGGLLFISGNTFFYTTAIVLWIFLILLMKYTEEVWLHKMFGIRYDRYKNATNAWFPIKPSNYISDDE